MPSKKCEWPRQILTTFFVTNIILTTVLGNVLHVNTLKRLAKPSETGGIAKRDIQNGQQIGNLLGKPGEGYYLQVEIGTPSQKVRT